MTAQHIMVDTFGRVVSAYADDNTVDLSALGRQSIKRFSEVLHDEERQLFFVQYRDTAPEALRDSHLTLGQYFAATQDEEPSVRLSRRLRDWAGRSEHDTAFFVTYKMAVEGEQAVLRHLMIEGDMG